MVGVAAVALLVYATWPAAIGVAGAALIAAALVGRHFWLLEDIRTRLARIERQHRDGHLQA